MTSDHLSGDALQFVWSEILNVSDDKKRYQTLSSIGIRLTGVGADECASENAARQARDVVALERVEHADRDFGGVGDGLYIRKYLSHR